MSIQRLKPLMLAGTASDVGKSIIAAAFCRIFRQDGYAPAPFKAQNMSLNSYVTPEGLEIGRAQAMQAEAAGIPCHTDMNPVLLKPTNHATSQVVLNGKPHGNQSACDYFNPNNREQLFGYVKEAFDRLHQQYNPIVMEGAGSIAELNLKKKDIVNLRMAAYAGAKVFLIADIDKGGVFASIYGTIKLLNLAEQDLIAGIIINKFRGDPRLFFEGRQLIEELTGKPVLAVLPWFNHIHLDEEDSVAIDKKPSIPFPHKVNIGVVRLPRMANYTDFHVFEHLAGVHLFYSQQPQMLQQADVIIIPGSKNTIEDLIFVKKTGLDKVIQRAHAQGKKVIGICGGFQMMGETIEDPFMVESAVKSTSGLGILPIKTTMLQEKQTLQQQFYFKESKEICRGYEIHMGDTAGLMPEYGLNQLPDGRTEGYRLTLNCYGTYMHGIFDNAAVLRDLFKDFDVEVQDFDFNKFKQQQYDKLAEMVRNEVDIKKIYSILS
jgi:adenosylcobyric acid synthase